MTDGLEAARRPLTPMERSVVHLAGEAPEPGERNAEAMVRTVYSEAHARGVIEGKAAARADAEACIEALFAALNVLPNNMVYVAEGQSVAFRDAANALADAHGIIIRAHPARAALADPPEQEASVTSQSEPLYTRAMTGSACEACSGRILSKKPRLCDRHAGDWILGFLESGVTPTGTHKRLSSASVVSQSQREAAWRDYCNWRGLAEDRRGAFNAGYAAALADLPEQVK